MEAWTEFDQAHGFRFQIVGEGGSSYIRRKVLLAALEGEQKLWESREPQRASLTTDNYSFQGGGLTPDGLDWLEVKPKRKVTHVELNRRICTKQAENGKSMCVTLRPPDVRHLKITPAGWACTFPASLIEK